MKKLSYLFIALFISACQAEPDFTEEVTPLLHTRAGSLQFAQTDNLNLDALGIVHPTKIVRKDSLYVILTPQSAYRFAIYNHLNPASFRTGGKRRRRRALLPEPPPQRQYRFGIGFQHRPFG